MPDRKSEEVLFALNRPPGECQESDYDPIMQLAELTVNRELPINGDGSVFQERIPSGEIPSGLTVRGGDGLTLGDCTFELSSFDVAVPREDDETYRGELDTEFFTERYMQRDQSKGRRSIHERRPDWYGAHGTNQRCGHFKVKDDEC